MNVVLWMAGAAVLWLLAVEVWVACGTRGRCFAELADLPPCEYGLVLGTAKYVAGGGVNRYYQRRMEAAAALWHAGKVRALVVSGSGLSGQAVSETVCMQADLVAAGVPEAAIWQDPAGLRTWDSVLRYRAAFGEASVCVVSQPFHCRRALILARAGRVDAVGYVAGSVGGWRVQLRERFARLRLCYDLWVRTPAQHDLAAVPIRQHLEQ